MDAVMSERDLLIVSGKICPYCGNEPELVDSSVIYGPSNYGKIHFCRPCDSYVGCHKGTTRAKGRLANKRLRFWKKRAHLFFDDLWKSEKMTRSKAYKWLSEKLNIPMEYTHIGMFDENQCRATVELCKELTKNTKNEQIKSR